MNDFDNDGDIDIFLTKAGENFTELPDEVWFNDGVGDFFKTQSLGNRPGTDVVSADFDGDNDIDVVVGQYGKLTTFGIGLSTNGNRHGPTSPLFSVWLNDGSGSFKNGGDYGIEDLRAYHEGLVVERMKVEEQDNGINDVTAILLETVEHHRGHVVVSRRIGDIQYHTRLRNKDAGRFEFAPLRSFRRGAE